MSHEAQRKFLEAAASSLANHFTNSSVLEVGSLIINGSARDFVVEPKSYIGIDVGDGPGVDIVADGATYQSAERFDLILSCECLEHNPSWRETLANCVRHLQDDGVLVLSFASIGRSEHGTSRQKPHASPLTVDLGWDHYMNLSTSRVAQELRDFGLAVWSATNWRAFDGYVVASKNREIVTSARRSGLDSFKRSLIRGNARLLPACDRILLSTVRAHEIRHLPSWARRVRNVIKMVSKNSDRRMKG